MKTKYQKGTHVCLSESGIMTNISTNLSHDIEIENGDTFAINWGHGDVNYKVIDSKYPIVAEEIEENTEELKCIICGELINNTEWILTAHLDTCHDAPNTEDIEDILSYFDSID